MCLSCSQAVDAWGFEICRSTARFYFSSMKRLYARNHKATRTPFRCIKTPPRVKQPNKPTLEISLLNLGGDLRLGVRDLDA